MKRTGLFLVALSLFGCDLTQDLGGGGSAGNTSSGGASSGGGTSTGGASNGGADTGGDTTSGGSAGMTMTGGAGGTTSTGGSINTGGGGAGTEWAITSPSGFARPAAVTVDDKGFITVAGTFYNIADFGAGAVTSKGDGDIFVNRYTNEGDLVWSNVYGTPQDDEAAEISSDAAGNIYVAGAYGGAIDFGTGPLPQASGLGLDDFLLKLDPTGKTLWAKGLGGGVDKLYFPGLPFWGNPSLAVSPSGEITFADNYRDPVSLGGGVTFNPTGPNAAGEGSDFFVARFDTNGGHVWSHAWGDADSDYKGDDVVSDIGLDASGNVFVAGHFGGPIDFGGGVLGAAGGSAMLVMKMDPSGNHVWSKAFGSHLSYPEAIAVTPDGGVFIGGSYKNLLDLSGSMLPASPFDSLFTAKLDAAGATLWTHGVPCPPGTSYIGGAASDAAGNTGIAGATEATIDFGAGIISSVWGGDYPFYGRYDPNGAVLTGKFITGSPPDMNIPTAGTFDLAYDPNTGHVVMVGTFSSTDLNFDGHMVSSASYNAMFVARTKP